MNFFKIFIQIYQIITKIGERFFISDLQGYVHTKQGKQQVHVSPSNNNIYVDFDVDRAVCVDGSLDMRYAKNKRLFNQYRESLEKKIIHFNKI